MLFAPESHAIWITDEVNELKLNSDRQQGIDVDDSDRLTAEIANAQFIVIECRLESAFADASVAYDVVGLRNMDVYMETPSGQRIYPIQKIMAPEAEESNQGALIRFARTSVIVFPKSSALDRSASPLSGAPGARLVIDGFHSRFYFEWTNMLQGDVIEVSDGPFNPEEAFVNAVRTGYTSIYSLLSPLQRIVE